MTPLEMLIKARELISSEEKWTQGALARDSKGRPTVSSWPDPACFCSIGALLAIENSDYLCTHGLFGAAYSALKEAMQEDVAKFNDSHTHAEVLDAYDKAIATLTASTPKQTE